MTISTFVVYSRMKEKNTEYKNRNENIEGK